MTTGRRSLSLFPTAVALFLVGCLGSGVSVTGLSGNSVTCPEGARQMLDCRGALQQFARDFRADVAALATGQAGAAVVTTKLIEADALSSDLVQHHYQTCTLYNACLLTRTEFVARVERLQQLQLDVRRTVGPGSTFALAAQQNVQINQPGVVPVAPSEPSGTASESGGPVVTPSETDTSAGSPASRLDAVLSILREGSRLFRGSGPTPYAPPTQDLDARLRSMLTTLRRDVASRQPGLASGTATVGNFTETGQPYAGPVGAVLQERVNALVQQKAVFEAGLPRTRGVTVKEVAGIESPNDPRALGRIYDTSIAIVGTYRPQPDQVAVTLTALDANGNQLAEVADSIPAAAIPAVVSATPGNAHDTAHLLDALNQLGPKTQGSARVDVTTNRPGAGAAFRLGEEIRYFVTSTMGGHLYLFHIDAEKNVTRIFPNDHQRQARVQAAVPIEIPGPGAPFTLQASPPFGLETTLALVTAAPLDEASLRAVGIGLARPTPEAVAGTRGIAVKAAGAGSSSSPAYVWNAVTVLVRP